MPSTDDDAHKRSTKPRQWIYIKTPANTNTNRMRAATEIPTNSYSCKGHRAAIRKRRYTQAPSKGVDVSTARSASFVDYQLTTLYTSVCVCSARSSTVHTSSSCSLIVQYIRIVYSAALSTRARFHCICVLAMNLV